MSEKPSTDPKELLMNISGKDYLPVAARIHLFRERFPIEEGWAIHTDQLAAEGLPPNTVGFRAFVVNPQGVTVATATKTKPTGGKFAPIESAETGAIGRAIGLAGIGTLFAQEWDEEEEDIADAPIASKGSPSRPTTAPKSNPPKQEKPCEPATNAAGLCTVCSAPVSKGRQDFCRTKKTVLTCGPTNPDCPSHPKHGAKAPATPAPEAAPSPEPEDDMPPPTEEEMV
jgi:hypothetical protein